MHAEDKLPSRLCGPLFGDVRFVSEFGELRWCGWKDEDGIGGDGAIDSVVSEFRRGSSDDVDGERLLKDIEGDKDDSYGEEVVLEVEAIVGSDSER